MQNDAAHFDAKGRRGKGGDGMTGTAIRLGRLFRKDSGRSFMVAFDRTLIEGPSPHGVDAEAALSGIVAAAPEAVLIGPGLIKHCGKLFGFSGAPAIVARIDYPMVAEFRQAGTELYGMVLEPAHAAALGADAAVMCLIDGFEDPRNYAANIRAVADAARACHAVGLPLIVEAVLWGGRNADQRDAGRLAAVCRIAAELGADAIKTQYPGTADGMRRIAESCPVPVLVLGGAAQEAGAVEAFTRGAIEGGARGVIYGRNVWQRDDVAAMAATLRRLVHAA
jgi:DhnA family fructose-bisphosphate aldolase class Ia